MVSAFRYLTATKMSSHIYFNEVDYFQRSSSIKKPSRLLVEFHISVKVLVGVSINVKQRV